jgi:ubiquitin-protein ligase
MSSITEPLTAQARNTALRHFVALQENPVPGVSMAMIDIQTFHVNTQIQDGIYEGAIIHWELTIPSTYPQTPPFGRVATGYDFEDKHHHHVFRSAGICADFLANFAYMSKTASAGYGWTPACDFVGLMINMQAFFADPDGAKLSQAELDAFRRMNDEYVCPHDLCGHSTRTPEPPLGFEGVTTMTTSVTTSHKNPIHDRARRELICSVSKQNIIDAKDMVLGYPINLRRDKYKRLHTELIPELISYDEYMHALQAANGVEKHLRSATGRNYTNWLPLYVSEPHYKLVESRLQAALSVCLRGHSGSSRNDFHESMVLPVLLPLMNKQVVCLVNGQEHESDATITAYCNLLRLLLRLMKDSPAIQKDVRDRVRRFRDQPKERVKTKCGDIGEFLIVLSLSNFGDEMFLLDRCANVKRPLLEEYFARQVRWIELDTPNALHEKQGIVSLEERLAICFRACETSNKLLVFNTEMANAFIVPSFEANMDRHMGLPPHSVLDKFRDRIRKIKTQMNNYKDLMMALRATDLVSNNGTMWRLLRYASQLSINQNYTKRPNVSSVDVHSIMNQTSTTRKTGSTLTSNGSLFV